MMERSRLLPEGGSWESWGVGGDDLTPLTELRESDIRARFSSAGVLPISEDGRRILLGAHLTGRGILYGPFAGGREGDEEPEATAAREAFEELGFIAPLQPPLVIVNAAKIATPRIGIIFPFVLGEDFIFQPNEEISETEWLGWSDVCRLMDESHPAWNLWGGTYTLHLLREWTMRQAKLSRQNSLCGEEMVKAMNGMVIVQDFYFGETPYQKIKKQEKNEK